MRSRQLALTADEACRALELMAAERRETWLESRHPHTTTTEAHGGRWGACVLFDHMFDHVFDCEVERVEADKPGLLS